MLVASFENPDAARAGAETLRALHAECSLTLYGMAVLARDGCNLVILEPMALADSPAAPAVGAAIGALVTLLGGSIGLASRTVPSGVVTAVQDLTEAGLDADFLGRVSRDLRPGGAAVLAEVEEDQCSHVDVRVATQGGRVSYQVILGTASEQRIVEAVVALRAELARLCDGRDRMANAADLQRILKRRSADLKEMLSDAQALAFGLRREGCAKVAVLRAQALRLEGAPRSEFERRASAVRMELERRASRLDRLLEGITRFGHDDT